MKINPDLIDLLQSNKLDTGDCVTYLLSLYFNFNVTYIPEGLKKRIHVLDIVTYNSQTTQYTWNVPLFENQVVNFEWIPKEYMKLFEPYRKHNKFKRECIARMQALLLDHPELHKGIILEATKLYIETCKRERRQAKYVTNPHYFIKKGRGVDTTHPILTYVDLLKESTTATQKRNSTSNTMQ